MAGMAPAALPALTRRTVFKPACLALGLMPMVRPRAIKVFSPERCRCRLPVRHSYSDGMSMRDR